MNSETDKKIDWIITLVPLMAIVILSILFFFTPDQSNSVLGEIRFFFGDTLGSFYLIVGFGTFLLSIYIAFSKYGNIRLGGVGEKPKYSFFSPNSQFCAGKFLFKSTPLAFVLVPFASPSGLRQGTNNNLFLLCGFCLRNSL